MILESAIGGTFGRQNFIIIRTKSKRGRLRDLICPINTDLSSFLDAAVEDFHTVSNTPSVTALAAVSLIIALRCIKIYELAMGAWEG